MHTVMSAVSNSASRMSIRTVETPEISATSGSNVVNSNWRYRTTTAAAVSTITIATNATSPGLTPSTLPNSSASKFTVNETITEMIENQTAKLVSSEESRGG